MKSQTTNPKKEAIRLTKLWQELGPNTYPINLDVLIEGAIQSSGFQDSLSVTHEPFESLEGCLVRTKSARHWTIALNSKIQNDRRLRFTYAHELGHFMCHRDLSDKFEDSVDSLNDFRNRLEQEANIFAAWLLMPANLIREEFGHCEWNTETLRKLGFRFECSLQASALRHVSLNPRPIAFVVSRDGMILWSCKSESAPFMTSYNFGDELPRDSQAHQSFDKGEASGSPMEVGPVWSSYNSAIESQYFDSSGQGYQYTCIEFS